MNKAGEYLRNKITNAVTESNDKKNCETLRKSKKCWRNNYSNWKTKWNIKQIEESIIKMEHYEISKLLNDSTVSKFVTKNGSK